MLILPGENAAMAEKSSGDNGDADDVEVTGRGGTIICGKPKLRGVFWYLFWLSD